MTMIYCISGFVSYDLLIGLDKRMRTWKLHGITVFLVFFQIVLSL